MKHKGILLILIILIAGCTQFRENKVAPTQELMPLSSCSEWDVMIAEIEKNINSTPDYYFSFIGNQEYAAAVANVTGVNAVPDYSSTNVQVEGVDEPDVIKTDGRYIYTIGGGYHPEGGWGKLKIFQGYPVSDASHIANLDIEYLPYGIFIWNNYAVVISGYFPAYIFILSPEGITQKFYQGNQYLPEGFTDLTKITVIDVSNPTVPRVIYEAFVDGGYTGARLIENTLYLIGYSVVGTIEYDEDDIVILNMPSLLRFNELRQSYKILPHIPLLYVKKVKDGNEEYKGRLIECTDCLVPPYPASPYITYILSLNINDLPVHPPAVGIAGIPSIVYASPENIYVSAMINRFQWDDSESPATVIHKFRIKGSERAHYTATGKVKGYLLNQFSMDENKGYLRVATTSGFFWRDEEEPIQSHIWVLEERARDLSQISSLSGIGKGENLYAVRFIGDIGYVVTFMMTDPLHIIDLRDPFNPKLRGELQVPGFSTYIHPIEDNYLLTIGYENWHALQLSIFDVNDLDAPKRLAQEVIPGDWVSSPAIYDHHAFNFFKTKGLLSLPLIISNSNESYNYFTGWSGFRNYSVSTTEGFKNNGELKIAVNNGSYWSGCNETNFLPLRTIYIDRYLYTLTTSFYTDGSFLSERSIITVSNEDNFQAPVAVLSDITPAPSLPVECIN